MIRATLLLLFSNNIVIHAQQTQATTDSILKMATVNVTVTSMNGKPRKGELIIFHGQTTGKIIKGVSDVAGKLKQLLPPGDTYNVSLKSVSDTTQYAAITVPTLAEDEFFTEPYWVRVKYDPARTYRLDNVHFDTDKATLRKNSYTQLNELLEYLERHEEIKIEIAGHTDNIGTASHNLKLSHERATTIRNYLTNKGVKGIRLTVKGYGDTQPIADNSTDEGRQLNRRTEVRIL